MSLYKTVDCFNSLCSRNKVLIFPVKMNMGKRGWSMNKKASLLSNGKIQSQNTWDFQKLKLYETTLFSPCWRGALEFIHLHLIIFCCLSMGTSLTQHRSELVKRDTGVSHWGFSILIWETFIMMTNNTELPPIPDFFFFPSIKIQKKLVRTWRAYS